MSDDDTFMRFALAEARAGLVTSPHEYALSGGILLAGLRAT